MTPPAVPSLKERELVALLCGQLGYSHDAKKSGGSHYYLIHPGRPRLRLAFHKGATVGPNLVWNILVKQARLTHAEALEVLRNA